METLLQQHGPDITPAQQREVADEVPFAPITTYAVQYYGVLHGRDESEDAPAGEPFHLHGYRDIEELMAALEDKGVTTAVRSRIFHALIRDNSAPKYERFDGFHVVTTLDDGILRRRKEEEKSQQASTQQTKATGWFDRP